MDYVLSDEEGGIVPKVLRDGLVFKDEDGQVIFNQYSFCELVKHLLVELVGISYEEASQIVERSPLAAPVDNAMDVAIFSHDLFYPQLGVKLCSMAGGGVQKIYMVFLREPSRRDRSGSDLFHLRDGFEIKMNFDRNVSCFIFVNALMHDDFFD